MSGWSSMRLELAGEEDEIPGVRTIFFSDCEHIYCQTHKKGASHSSVYKRWFRDPELPILRDGAASFSGNCIITTPEGIEFHAAFYQRDIEGFLKQFSIMRARLGLSTAVIDGVKFRISNGVSFNLNECVIRVFKR